MEKIKDRKTQRKEERADGKKEQNKNEENILDSLVLPVFNAGINLI